MQAKGRTIVFGIFGVGIAMSLGAWWFRYQASRQAAAFWGPAGAPLVVGESKLTLATLGDADSAAPAETVAGLAAAKSFDLTDQRGVIHLRYALTQDANFSWPELKREAVGGGSAWRYALRFAQGDERLDVLLADDFGRLGKVDADGAHVEVVPCPRLAPVLLRYLTDVGAPLVEKAPVAAGR